MRQHASEVFVGYLIVFYRNFPDYTTVTEMGLYQYIVGVSRNPSDGACISRTSPWSQPFPEYLVYQRS